MFAKSNWRVILGALAVTLAVGCGVEKTETPAAQSEAKAPAASASQSASASSQITTPTGIRMVLIPAGEFTMGSDNGESDERPPHVVTLDSFYMDVYEVSQRAYESLAGINPSKHKGQDQPVEQLGWLAAIKYCNLRSLKEGLQPCYSLDTLSCDFSANGYRLPTEAEWEYACRAGSTGDYSMEGGASSLGEVAWIESNANKTPHPVGSKRANAWGLHDMHGNVAEWCNDVYREDYYVSSPRENPCAEGDGDERVLRGGAWNSSPDACRSSARWSEAPGLADVCFGYDAYGFRCVRRAVP